MRDAPPAIVVLSSLFPRSEQPGAGLFVRERMFRVGQKRRLSVVSPVAHFPGQALVRLFKPHYRPGAAKHETQSGFDVWFPRFFSLPGTLRRLDGLMMALGALPRLRALKRQGQLDVLDAHFGYPDGYAATLLGRWLGVPVSITLRGTEVRHAADPVLRPLLQSAVTRADAVFTVSSSLAQIALDLGADPRRVQVVGNGVDLSRFSRRDRTECRRKLGLPDSALVLVTVGGLVERKGFHRVIECLPMLRERLGDVRYLVVGGPSPEGDWTGKLKQQATDAGLQDAVHFLGPMAPEALSAVLSAADVFALYSANEGWANVLLEAMACGLPVVASDVGGNAEVVCRPDLGLVVPFDRAPAGTKGLGQALHQALQTNWDRSRIQQYAAQNTWDLRVTRLLEAFDRLTRRASPEQPGLCARELQ